MKPLAIHLVEQDKILSTREAARKTADQIQDSRADGAAIILNFAGVEIATPSFVDELLMRLRALRQSSEPDAVLVVGGMNDEVTETLGLVLAHRKLALAQLSEDHIQLLGGSRQLKQTFEAASKLQTFTAPELADELKIKLPNLHQRLNALLDAGAVSRVLDDTVERGKRFKYAAPDAKLVAAS